MKITFKDKVLKIGLKDIYNNPKKYKLLEKDVLEILECAEQAAKKPVSIVELHIDDTFAFFIITDGNKYLVHPHEFEEI